MEIIIDMIEEYNKSLDSDVSHGTHIDGEEVQEFLHLLVDQINGCCGPITTKEVID